jgi:hypothetical protein
MKKEKRYKLTEAELEQLCELIGTAEELVRKSAETNYEFFTQLPLAREGFKNFIFSIGKDIDKALNVFFKLKYLLKSFGKHNVMKEKTKDE